MDSQLQSGIGGASKWEPGSWLGIYVGHSPFPSHASFVALALNPWMGHVSPQYHVVFDDLFTTVPFMEKSEVPPHWADLVERSREHVTDEHYELAKMWLFSTHEPGDISMPDCTNNDPNLGTSSKTNPSISTVSTRIKHSPSNLGLSSLLDASRLSKDYVSSTFLHPVSSFHQDKNSKGYILPSHFEDPLLVPHLTDLET